MLLKENSVRSRSVGERRGKSEDSGIHLAGIGQQCDMVKLPQVGDYLSYVCSVLWFSNRAHELFNSDGNPFKAFNDNTQPAAAGMP